MKKIIKLMCALLFTLITSTSYADLTEGVDYVLLDKEITQLDDSKIEVLEFFSFVCVHCYHLQPILAKESQKFLDDTYLRKEHVVWSDDFIDYARLLYATKKSGVEDIAEHEIFKATIDDKINVPENFKKWLNTQKNWNTNALEQAYNSKNSLLATNKMEQLTTHYNITATPTIIVGGKYKLLLHGDYEQSMDRLNQLIDKVRKEKNIMLNKKKNSFIPSIGQKIAISVM